MKPTTVSLSDLVRSVVRVGDGRGFIVAAGDDVTENGPVGAALAEFRGSIAVLLPHLGGGA